jgi:DNA-binding transcriptional MerR regulator/methylmalonyl-CoA mutase cobalamin-binding subunit
MQGSPDGNKARHPIRVVAKRTGLSLHLLRAWERRYGVVVPTRSAGGQRLYSDADIERLRLLREAVDAGRSISQVASLDDAELAGLVNEDRPGEARVAAAVGAGSAETDMQHYLEATLRAAERMDDDALHRLLMHALLATRPLDFIHELIGPLLGEVGTRWQDGQLKPAHEHTASIAVRRVLGFMLDAYEPERDAPTLVSTTLTGDPHELGAMMAGVVAGEAGWRVLYLGPSLPAEEIARAAILRSATAVAVSAVDELGEGAIAEELRRLRAALPRRVRLFAGGRAVQSSAEVFADIDGLEVASLERLREALRRSAAASGV